MTLLARIMRRLAAIIGTGGAAMQIMEWNCSKTTISTGRRETTKDEEAQEQKNSGGELQRKLGISSNGGNFSTSIFYQRP